MAIDLGKLDHIGDIGMRSFSAALQEDGSLSGDEQVTVTVNHNKFNVRILDDGKLSVSFASGNFFTNLFRGDTLKRARQQLQEAYSEMSDWTKLGSAGAKVDQLAGSEVIHYGFHDMRVNAVRKMGYGQEARLNTIDQYNSNIGLTWDLGDASMDVSNCQQTLKQLENPDSFFEDNRADWARYLKDHIGKLDVFGRISSYISAGEKPETIAADQRGWLDVFRRKGVDGGLRELVRKNVMGSDIKPAEGKFPIDPEDFVELCVQILKDLNGQNVDGLEADEVDALRDARVDKMLEEHLNASSSHGDADAMDRLKQAFNNVLNNMFFRQTSKLGLDFMKAKKIPVIVQWQCHDGQPLSRADFEDKWWKRDGEKVSAHYGATITFSEMRHIEKLGYASGEDRSVHKVRN